MKKIEQVGKKIVTQMTLDSRFGWPPECAALFYQPQRPVEKMAVAQNTVSEVSTLEKNRNN